tara:strand:+ start:3725 stop:4492 length:768 start_codon:yes stop_codon:yes gene_type:complete
MKTLVGLCLLFVINSGVCKAGELPDGREKELSRAVRNSVNNFISTMSPDKIEDRIRALRDLQRTVDFVYASIRKDGFISSSEKEIPTSLIEIPAPKRTTRLIWDMERTNPYEPRQEKTWLSYESLLIQFARKGCDVGIQRCLSALSAEETYEREKIRMELLTAMGQFLMAFKRINAEGLSPEENLATAAHRLYATAKIGNLKYRGTCDGIVKYLNAKGKDGRNVVRVLSQGVGDSSASLRSVEKFAKGFQFFVPD